MVFSEKEAYLAVTGAFNEFAGAKKSVTEAKELAEKIQAEDKNTLLAAMNSGRLAKAYMGLARSTIEQAITVFDEAQWISSEVRVQLEQILKEAVELEKITNTIINAPKSFLEYQAIYNFLNQKAEDYAAKPQTRMIENIKNSIFKYQEHPEERTRTLAIKIILHELYNAEKIFRLGLFNIKLIRNLPNDLREDLCAQLHLNANTLTKAQLKNALAEWNLENSGPVHRHSPKVKK